ncbi:hypothetical protein BDZ91DRAFT_543576 [Kalaharituber pfeilii]|nr:hypothetical protein BDZ91DRAFT_543576 [Kalaharituber pfeilii]
MTGVPAATTVTMQSAREGQGQEPVSTGQHKTHDSAAAANEGKRGEGSKKKGARAAEATPTAVAQATRAPHDPSAAEEGPKGVPALQEQKAPRRQQQTQEQPVLGAERRGKVADSDTSQQVNIPRPSSAEGEQPQPASSPERPTRTASAPLGLHPQQRRHSTPQLLPLPRHQRPLLLQSPARLHTRTLPRLPRPPPAPSPPPLPPPPHTLTSRTVVPLPQTSSLAPHSTPLRPVSNSPTSPTLTHHPGTPTPASASQPRTSSPPSQVTTIHLGPTLHPHNRRAKNRPCHNFNSHHTTYHRRDPCHIQDRALLWAEW